MKANREIIEAFNAWQKGKGGSIDLGEVEFEEKKLGDGICSFPSLTNVSGIDISVEQFKELCEEDRQSFAPKVTGTLDNNQISGYVQRKRLTDNALSSGNVISWTRINGKEFFFQPVPVCTSDDSFVMEPLEGHEVKYVRLALLGMSGNSLYDWSRKLGMREAKKISIPIPKGDNSLAIQKEIVAFIEDQQSRIHGWIDSANDLMQKIDEYGQLVLAKMFLPEKSDDLLELFAHWQTKNKRERVDLGVVDFEEKKLGDGICSFPSLTNVSGIDISVEQFKELSEVDRQAFAPKVTGTLDNNQISGYVQRKRLTDNALSSGNVISWTRINGKEFFFQPVPVCTSDDSFVMEPLEGHEVKYVRLALLGMSGNSLYDWSKKLGMREAKKISIPIPKGDNSLAIQKEIVAFIEAYQSWQEVMRERVESFTDLSEKYEQLLLAKMFQGDRG